jgi:hypothetical protein
MSGNRGKNACKRYKSVKCWMSRLLYWAPKGGYGLAGECGLAVYERDSRLVRSWRRERVGRFAVPVGQAEITIFHSARKDSCAESFQPTRICENEG